MYFVENIDYLLALGTIALQLASVFFVVVLVLRRRNSWFNEIAESLGSWTLWIAFLIAFAGSLFALVYSDVFGFEPCPLCWWQRIFLFPQVILLGMALRKGDWYIADYSLVLSIFGAAVALYQHALQMLPGSGLPCPATGVSCAQRIIFQFDYITMPLMSFTIFALLIVLMLFARTRQLK